MKKICPNCKTENSTSYDYTKCWKCGTNLSKIPYADPPAEIINQKETKTRKMIFSGEPFMYDPEENTLSFTIREGAYITAGKRFKWEGKTIGLSINIEALKFAVQNKAQIRVIIGNSNKIWEANAIEWWTFCNKHHSFYQQRKTTLCCAQWDSPLFKHVGFIKK